MGDTAYVVDDKAVREDLLSVLTNLTPTDTQLVTGLGTSEAKSTRHEWLTDTLSAVKSNAYIEGVDASFADVTNPTRLLNYTQIFRQGYKVSDTERAVNTAAFDDRFAYEGVKALKMLKNDMEYSIMRGTLACGAGSSTAGTLKGIKNWLDLASSESGVTLSESKLNDYLQLVWDNGTEVDEIYGDMYMKRKISGFTAGATKNVNITDRRLVNSVDVYEADAAKLVKLFAHRHVSISGTDTNHDLVGINSDLFRVAYLRKPQDREIPRTGDSTKGEVLTEMTLECLHEDGGFYLEKAL